MTLNEEQIRKECQIVKEKGITDIAIVGIFSPLDTEGLQEVRVKEIVTQELPGADVVISRESKLHALFRDFLLGDIMLTRPCQSARSAS
jgi:N-methylhydantoinase A/oxoprolinase/acetone carboxylase beta subunit